MNFIVKSWSWFFSSYPSGKFNILFFGQGKLQQNFDIDKNRFCVIFQCTWMSEYCTRYTTRYYMCSIADRDRDDFTNFRCRFSLRLFNRIARNSISVSHSVGYKGRSEVRPDSLISQLALPFQVLRVSYHDRSRRGLPTWQSPAVASDLVSCASFSLNPLRSHTYILYSCIYNIYMYIVYVCVCVCVYR